MSRMMFIRNVPRSGRWSGIRRILFVNAIIDLKIPE